MNEKKRTKAVEYAMTKDEKLKNDVVKENEPLIMNIIQKQFNFPNEHEDLMQAGRLGVLKAVNKFDPEKGKFSTLATQAIRNNIIMHLKKSTHEYGSYLHQRTNVGGDEILKNIPCENKNLGVFEAVSHVFKKLPAEDVNILKAKFGMSDGKYTFFQKSRALTNFKKVMRAEGIKRSDFYA